MIGNLCLYALFPQSDGLTRIYLSPVGPEVTQPGIESNSVALGKLLNHASALLSWIT